MDIIGELEFLMSTYEIGNENISRDYILLELLIFLRNCSNQHM